MANHKSFKSAFKSIEKKIETSKKQAMSRALTSARTEYVKAVKAETGLPAKVLRKRVRFERIGSSIKNALSIGVRRLFPVHAFPFKTFKVRGVKGPGIGVRIKTPQGNQYLKESFPAIGKNSGKKIVLYRYGRAINQIKETLYDIFKLAVVDNAPKIKQKFAESFKKNLSSNIKYNLRK